MCIALRLLVLVLVPVWDLAWALIWEEEHKEVAVHKEANNFSFQIFSAIKQSSTEILYLKRFSFNTEFLVECT